MLFRSLVEVEKAIRSSWCADTCDPVDLPKWSAMNPARGQCASTALIVQELLGGQLLIADVRHADGTRQGVHYWNRLPSGLELDLTREQFLDSEAISRPRVVRRPQDTTQGRLSGQYRLLAETVRAKLAVVKEGVGHEIVKSPRAAAVGATGAQNHGSPETQGGYSAIDN